MDSGSVEVSPNGGHHLHPDGGEGHQKPLTATVTITVTVIQPTLPTIDTFVSDDYSIQTGESATLRWDTTNAVSARINRGIGGVAVDGSRTVSPTVTTNYTLTAVGSGGEEVTESLTIVVSDCDLPTVNSFAADDTSIEDWGKAQRSDGGRRALPAPASIRE